MKRAFALCTLLGLMFLPLAACGGKTEPVAPAAKSDAAPPAQATPGNHPHPLPTPADAPPEPEVETHEEQPIEPPPEEPPPIS